jgi:hypothetical protein
LGRIVKSWGVIVAVLTVAVYILGRTWLVSFYAEFGIEPERVGLNQTAVLIRAAPAAFLLIGTALIIAATLLLLGRLVGRLLRIVMTADEEVRRNPRRLPNWLRAIWPRARWWWELQVRVLPQLALQAGLIILVVLGFQVVRALSQTAQRVLQGRQIDGWTGFIFPVRTECVEVQWLDPPTGSVAESLPDGAEVLFFGGGNGIIVLLTSGDMHRTMRLPAGRVVLISSSLEQCAPTEATSA